MSQAVVIESTGGVRLEGEYDTHDAPGGGLVVCHAHPQMSGTMRSPLLLAVRDEVWSRGWSVLRFNFRGNGGSTGVSGDGTGEIDDALGAVRHLRGLVPDVPLAVLGWSFGGAVALRAAEREDKIEACVAIAPAIERKPGRTMGLPPGDALGIDVPVLVVCGGNDEQVAPADCRAWAAAAGARYEEIPAANHFFWAKYEAVTGIVAEFLDGII